MQDEIIKMSISDKRKYFRKVSQRYQRSSREDKGIILDKFCAIFEFED